MLCNMRCRGGPASYQDISTTDGHCKQQSGLAALGRDKGDAKEKDGLIAGTNWITKAHKRNQHGER